MQKYLVLPLLLALASCGGRQNAINEPPPPHLADWKPSLHLADTSLAGGLPGMALEVTDELLADNPRDVDALTRRGAALMQLGRRREAEIAYRSALAVAPQEPAALLGLGRLRLADDPEAAEKLFFQAATVNPHNSAALNDLGVSRDLQGHHTAAQEAYRAALAAEPTSAAAQANLGLSTALSGDPAAAERLLRPLAAEPDATPTIRHDLAVALTLSGKAREAASLLARDLPPDEVRSTLAGFQSLQK